ncbi:MAG: sensor histidine kinase [Oscillospiraceae bacterium]|nr:sensor histidine kinase [Oscillospiraceae bacterium]
MIRGYLRYRRAMLCAALMALLVFPCVMALCGIGFTMIAYAALVYAFVIAVFVALDAGRYAQKVKSLTEISENLTSTSHEYPRAENNIEHLYSQIIASLYRIMDNERSGLALAHAEQIDYYTLWLHQIKTPIAAMRLTLENDPNPDPVCAQELFKIERYVEMALQFVKLRGPESDLVLAPCDVDRVLRETVRRYATLFIAKGLGVDFAPTDIVAVTDEKWLSFIVGQLLSNAAKYTPEGSVKIYGAADRFTVEDSGIGIRSEDLTRIFEKGYTGFNGRLDKRASGLGLYMASQAAQMLGLSLSVRSAVGVGTAMTVVFGSLPKQD